VEVLFSALVAFMELKGVAFGLANHSKRRAAENHSIVHFAVVAGYAY